MDYSLRELECFTAVAEELSFTRAAQRLHLAQPPLSRHVRTLEEKLGTALFVRTNRKVALTPAGALFYEETRTVLPQLRRAGEATRRFGAGETAVLRLGFVSAVLSPELVETLRAFRERHPGIQLPVQDLPPAEQLAALRRGTLDGGFVGLRPAERTPGIVFVPWRREPLAAFVPFGHSLAERRELSLRDLAGQPLVAVSREAAPAFAAFLHGACSRAGFRPRIVLESPRAQAVAVMVAAGAGIALLPASLARVVGNAAAVLPLKKVPAVTHVFARGAGSPSEPMRQLINLLAA
jgi:DNA-binding transcriptional LysR family regulator